MPRHNVLFFRDSPKGLAGACALLLALLPLRLAAQAGSTDSVSMVVDFEDVVVTAQYAPTSSRAALYPIRAIRREEIRQRGAVNLEQLLSQELNIRLSQDLILGSSLSLQGIGGQNVKIMVDGVPVIGRTGDAIDLGQLQLGNIQRVEIVEGPMSVHYGTDALGGVINLITRRNQPKRYEATFNSQWEGVGTWNLQAGLGARLHDRLLLQVDGTLLDSEGFNVLPPGEEHDGRTFQWNPERQWGWNAQLRYDLDPDRHLRLRTAWFDETITNLGAERRPQFEPYAFDDFYFTRRLDHALHYEGAFAGSLYWHVTAGHNRFVRRKQTFRQELSRDERSLVSGQQDTTRYAAWTVRPVLASRFPDSRWQFQAGLDLRHERGRGRRLAEPEAEPARGSEMADYALFGTLDYRPFDSLHLQAGARMAYNTRFAVPVVPSFHLRYDWHPRWRLKASYAAGFRSPSIKELFFYFVDASHFILGNPDLQAERSNQVQLLLETEQPLTGRQSWRASLTGFYNHIRNRIGLYDFVEIDGERLPAASLDTVGNRFAYFNQAEYRVLGGNLRLGYTGRQLEVSVGIAPIGRYNPLSREAEVPTYTLATELNGQVQYRFPSIGLRTALYVRYNDKLIRYYQSTDQAGNPIAAQSVQEGFLLADLTLLQNLWDDRLQLQGGVKNLFDVRNVAVSGAAGGAHSGGENTSPIARGRYVFFGLQWQLAFD